MCRRTVRRGNADGPVGVGRGPIWGVTEPADTGAISLDDRLADASGSLSAAERRVAEVVVADRELVAFGTVARIAERAGTSGATVVRFADRLGYSGFRGLQESVRADLSHRLLPAAARIRRPVSDDLVGGLGRSVAASLERTLRHLDPAEVDRAVRLLAGRRRRVFVMGGDAGSGVAHQVSVHLSMLREGVEELVGGAVEVGRTIARSGPDDVLVVIDLPRYDRAVLDVVAWARGRGLRRIAVTDSSLSPVAAGADVVLTVQSHDVGPFDSYVSALAVGEVLVAGVAVRMGRSAVDRLDALESVWVDTDALSD